PASLAAALRPAGAYVFSSRDLPESLYRIETYFRQAWDGTAPEYAAVGFDGHGVNSWAAHVYLVHGPAALFLQCRWGNAYDDKNRARERIEGIFGLAGEVLAALEKAGHDGRLAAGRRLVLRHSDFSGSGWGWAGQPESWRNEGELSLLSALEAVAALPAAGS
ncbi:MAG: hypothetical protein ACO1N5_03700, partial [Noviherbaspirillum sp.]